MDKLKKALPFIFPPLAVLLIMGFAFYRHGLYPFGDGTVSWCDMSQQVIPLLTDFKDIFTGKDGMFLNFHNAGGMDLWGVFFFFIASPYTLLVLFVDKADIIYLVNILTVLKMMTAAVTAQIYFRSCQKKLDPYIGAVLSVIYAFCGYGMFYYQNNIWLDMMYLFPLLMVAFRELFAEEEYAIAMKLDNTELQTAVNGALKELKADGTLDAIKANYVGENAGKNPYKSPDNVSRDKGTLVMATNAEFPPYESKENDKVVGIDADMMQAVCDKLGYELKIDDMAFDSIISAVQSGKADVGVAGMTVTPDREKNVLFSDTYTSSSQVIIVRKK